MVPNECTFGLLIDSNPSSVKTVPNQSTPTSSIEANLDPITCLPDRQADLNTSRYNETINGTQQIPAAPTDSLSTVLRNLVHDWETPGRQQSYTSTTFPSVPNGLPSNASTTYSSVPNGLYPSVSNGLPGNSTEGLQPNSSVPYASLPNVLYGETPAELHPYPSGSTYMNAPVPSGPHYPIPSRLPPSLPTTTNGSMHYDIRKSGSHISGSMHNPYKENGGGTMIPD